MKIPEHILSTLTEEQKKKAEAVQTPEDLLALAKESGYELTPEQLEDVAGGDGSSWCSVYCPDYTCHKFWG